MLQEVALGSPEIQRIGNLQKTLHNCSNDSFQMSEALIQTPNNGALSTRTPTRTPTKRTPKFIETSECRCFARPRRRQKHAQALVCVQNRKDDRGLRCRRCANMEMSNKNRGEVLFWGPQKGDPIAWAPHYFSLIFANSHMLAAERRHWAGTADERAPGWSTKKA